MVDRQPGTDRCTLCGEPLDEPVVSATDSSRFCSIGCRDVYEALEPEQREAATAPDGDERSGEPGSTRSAETKSEGTNVRTNERGAATDDEGFRRTFFRVDGMHAATCEAFLESIAEARDGVTNAAASYVTETVRVDHDPDLASPTELRDALSAVGYTAYLREDATAESDRDDGAEGAGATGKTRRNREMTGLRKRRSEDVFELRYVFGVVFGSFLLIPFVTIFYPTHLAEFSDWWLLSRYEGSFASNDGFIHVPVFATLTGAILYLTGMPLLRGAYVSVKLRRPTAELLAAVTIVSAYLYGTVAFVLGRTDVYYDLTILVAAFVMGATFYETSIKQRAVNRLTDLTVSQVDEARRLERDGTTTTVPVADLEAGDRVLVPAGERIPVDGVLAEGECTVDEAIVTGESLPIAKAAGDGVLGGSVVVSDAADVRVPGGGDSRPWAGGSGRPRTGGSGRPTDTGTRTTSRIDRLTEAVWNIQSAAHGGQHRGNVLAGRFLPIVLGAVVVVGFAAIARGGTATTALLAACLAVIVASPWALEFATRVSVATALEEAMERGIVVFDETVFDRLRDVETIVFDKTGTLTSGEMTVLEADVPDDLLVAAALLEQRSSHPAAAAIETAVLGSGDELESAENAAAETDGGLIDRDGDLGTRNEFEVREFRSRPTGVEGVVDGDRVLVGHPDLFADRGWTLDSTVDDRIEAIRERGRLPVVVGRNGSAEGIVVVGDEPREGWAETVTDLHDRGVDIVVLTGDDRTAAEAVRAHPRVDRVFANVPPAGKTAAIRGLAADGRVAMVGDGTNDAPALAAADVGICLGSGTALAADAAALAIANDDLAAVDRAFELADAQRRRRRENLRLALVYNAIAVPVAIAGFLNPLVTTAAVLATASLVAANASRSRLSD